MIWYIIEAAVFTLLIFIAGFIGFQRGRNKLFTKEPIGTLWVDGADVFLQIENLNKLEDSAVIMRVQKPSKPRK